MNNDLYNGIYNEIASEYEKITETNREISQKTKEHIYTHFPRIKEIDSALRDISLKACKIILEQPADSDKAIEKLQNTIDSLNEEKKLILSSADLSEDCMSEIYNCPDCRDTGWHNGKRCKCFHDKKQKILQSRANITADKMHSFNKFNTELYSSETDNEYGISPRENAENILQLTKQYAKINDKICRRLLFYGNTGIGKTFTSECIAREFIKKGKSVFYSSAPKLFSIFEDYKFGKSSGDNAKNTVEYILGADLLIIDDLGTEFRTQYTDSILFDIINTAINENKYLIISTNLFPTQLEATYSQRISSRIIGEFDMLLFLGDDIRLKNK